MDINWKDVKIYIVGQEIVGVKSVSYDAGFTPTNKVGSITGYSGTVTIRKNDILKILKSLKHTKEKCKRIKKLKGVLIKYLKKRGIKTAIL